MKIMKILKKPKIKQEDLEKIDSTVKEIKECLFCKEQKAEIKKCAESKNVKNNLKAVTWHIIKCPDCLPRILLIKECKKRGHR